MPSKYFIEVRQGDKLLGYIHKKSKRVVVGKRTTFLNPFREDRIAMRKSKQFSSKWNADAYAERCTHKNSRLTYCPITVKAALKEL